MSADNFVAVIKEGKRKWVGYYCCASIGYPFNDCLACIASKRFEATSKLKALHEAQKVEDLEYGYSFMDSGWMTQKQKSTICPCEQKDLLRGLK